MRRIDAGLAVGVALAAATTGLAQGYPAEPLLSTGRSVIGETIVYPDGGPPLVTSAIVTLAPGERTVTHRHGAPMFAYMLEGELTVDYGPHGRRVYEAGDALMEAMAIAHFGMNTGQGPARILVVYIGAEGVRNVEPTQ